MDIRREDYDHQSAGTNCQENMSKGSNFQDYCHLILGRFGFVVVEVGNKPGQTRSTPPTPAHFLIQSLEELVCCWGKLVMMGDKGCSARRICFWSCRGLLALIPNLHSLTHISLTQATFLSPHQWVGEWVAWSCWGDVGTHQRTDSILY